MPALAQLVTGSCSTHMVGLASTLAANTTGHGYCVRLALDAFQQFFHITVAKRPLYIKHYKDKEFLLPRIKEYKASPLFLALPLPLPRPLAPRGEHSEITSATHTDKNTQQN